jgi:hypothetical protein
VRMLIMGYGAWQVLQECWCMILVTW